MESLSRKAAIAAVVLAAATTANANEVHLPSLGLRRLQSEPGSHAIFTWFQDGECTASRTRILLTTDECQLNPGMATEGYSVTCNENLAGGTASFFASGQCTGAGQDFQFTNGACIVLGEGAAARAFAVTCDNDAVQNIAPQQGEVAFTWYAEADCQASGGGTLIFAQNGVCQNGYRVTCNELNNGGTWDTSCSSPTDPFGCDVCENSEPFDEDQCLANSAQYGSRSVSFSCQGLPTPPNDPNSTGGRTPPAANASPTITPTGVATPSILPTRSNSGASATAVIQGGLIAAAAITALNLVRQ